MIASQTLLDLLPCEIPVGVVRPVLNALNVDWSALNPVDVLNAALRGPGGHNPGNRRAIVLDMIPRFAWTEEAADLILQRVRTQDLRIGVLHPEVALATAHALVEHASPLGRTQALTWVLSRATGSMVHQTTTRQRLADHLLTLPCQTTDLEPNDSPFTTVSTWADHQALQQYGFKVDGQTLAQAVRDRAPNTFGSSGDRQKILDALPSVDMTLESRLILAMVLAKTWADVAKAIKAEGKTWVSVRFADGDTLLHKAFERNPDWAIRLIEHPAAVHADPSWAVDGHGDHLIWRTMWETSCTRSVVDPDRPPLYGEPQRKEVIIPDFRARASASGFGPAWDQWSTLTHDRTAAVVASLRAVEREALGNPSALPSHQKVWPAPALNAGWWALFETLPAATNHPGQSPALRTAVNNVVRSSVGVGGLAQLVVGNQGVRADLGLLGPLLNVQDPALKTWGATLLLSTLILDNAIDVRTTRRLLDHGADWNVVDERLSAGHLAWPTWIQKPEVRDTWGTGVRSYWETVQLRRASAPATSLDQPLVPRSRL